MKFASDKPRILDFSDPGTGKTRAHLEVYRQNPDGRLLILCPKTLMVCAWGHDIDAFTPDLGYAYARADNRREAFESGAQVVITNIDAIRWLDEKKNWEVLRDFDNLIIDEASAYKHPTSQRSRAMVKLRKFFSNRSLLTATPNPNSVTELWNLAMICDDGQRLGTSFFKFRAAVQIPTQIGPGTQHLRWDDKPGIAPAVHQLLADISIRHEFDVVMPHVPKQLPPETKAFDLSPKALKAYRLMEQTAILELSKSTITAVHAAAVRTKLLQIASGAVYTGGPDSEYALIDTNRYELIGDLIEERDHSVTFFNWKHQRDELIKTMKKRGFSYALIDGSVNDSERDRIVQQYQDGYFKTLFLHPRTGAHGLTLTRGTTTIFASPIYEADLLKQAIHRIYRGGQTQRTNTIFVHANNTVEAQVYDRLFTKGDRMLDLLGLLAQRQ